MKNPVLFIGHGSPMNALASNEWTRTLHRLGDQIKAEFPIKAILMISAHWVTEQLMIQASPQPQQIYDFYGFPPELSAVRYPAKGSPELAERTQRLLAERLPEIPSRTTLDWGMDHGAWSILLHLFPKAEFPVVQLSLPASTPLEEFLKIGAAISSLRSEEILIIASGNIVHNLRTLDWQNEKSASATATQFDHWVTTTLLDKKTMDLASLRGVSAELLEAAHPTLEHYVPLLVAAGAASDDSLDKNAIVQIPFQEIHHGSISMTCVSFGFALK